MSSITFQNNYYKIYSFDIFDTLVTRKVATPAGIFALMQQILLEENWNIDSVIKNNFYNIRIGAESSARVRESYRKETREIFFDDIYNVIQNNYSIQDKDIEKLKALEIETEINNLVPIVDNINNLKKLLEKGDRVILISDMYFKEKELRYILSHVDSIFNKLPIYVSSEYKASKGDGKLWDIVKEKEKIESNSYWLHYGDNKFADIQKAKEKNIATQLVINEPLYGYEKALLDKNPANAQVQISIGNARCVRLNKEHTNQIKYEFGASFAGPILCGYVNWILKEAIKNNYKTLYFIARDGYIPKIIADIFIENRNLPIKTKYIYGSRKAWRIPAEETYDDLINQLEKEFPDSHTAAFISMKLNVDVDEFCKKFEIKNSNKKFKTKIREEVFNKLRHDKNIKEWIINNNLSNKQLLIEYFKQDVDFNESDFAFVDMHGSGKTQYYLSQILFPKFKKIIKFFYYSPTPINSGNNYKIYSYKLQFYYDLLYELLTRNIEGQLLKYKNNNGKIIVETEFLEDQNLLNWGFKDYIEGIIDYAKVCSNSIYSPDYYFTYLLNRKDKKLAEILGTIVLNNTGTLEKNCSVVAPKYNIYKMLCNFCLCKKPEANDYIFYRLSMIRSTKGAQKVKLFIDKYVTAQKFLFNIYFNRRTKIAFIRFLGIKISFKKLIWREKR